MDKRDKSDAVRLMLILPIIAVGMFIISFVRGHIIMKHPLEETVSAAIVGSLVLTVTVLISYFIMREAERRRGE